MTPAEAKHFIKKHFGPTAFNDDTGNTIPEETFLDILSAIDHLIPFPDNKQNENLSRFLWAGCRKFNRWFAPSPYIVPTEFEQVHAQFATALQNANRETSDNSAVFLVHAARDQLYRTFNNRSLPLSPDGITAVEDLEKQVNLIRPPTSTTKLQEFQIELTTVMKLLHALRGGDLRTHCRMSLPYPLLRGPLSFRFLSEGVSIEGKLTPSFKHPTELMIRTTPPNAMSPSGATRWQFGVTQVELSFASLVDHSIKVDPLQVPREPPPTEGWPNIFRTVFNIMYELSWRLRQHGAFVGVWVPSPADMGDIEYHISTAQDSNINFIRKCNPAMALIGFTPSKDIESVDLGKIESTSWHNKCRILSEQYLALGDTREALFWLNVGIESFLDERMRTLLCTSGATIDETQIAGAPSYWDAAKSLVSEQFPDIANCISWPTSVPHVSMYKRLNFFAKNVALKNSARKITAAYSKIQRDRNALFHGQSEAQVSANRVREAMENFDWLLENFTCA